MFRKLALALIAATALGTAAITPTTASAFGHGGFHGGFHGYHGGFHGFHGYRHWGWGYRRYSYGYGYGYGYNWCDWHPYSYGCYRFRPY